MDRKISSIKWGYKEEGKEYESEDLVVDKSSK